MSRGAFDVGDMIASAAFLFFGVFHLVEPDVLAFLTAEIWSVTNDGWTTAVTIAFLGSLASFGYIAFSNDWRGTGAGHTVMQTVLVFVTFWLIISPPFIPVMELLVSSQIAAFGALLLQFATTLVVGYFG